MENMESKDARACRHDCKCPHHKMIPGIVILFGLTLLIGVLGVISLEAVSIVLPVLIILGGLQKMMGGMCKCCKHCGGGNSCCGTEKK